MTHKKLFIVIGLVSLSVGLTNFFSACKKAVALTEDELNEWYSGGVQTAFNSGSGAYSQEFNGLPIYKSILHGMGDAGFEAVFNSDPNQLNYGLGPLYNNVSCASCHVGDGRGKAPEAGENLNSLLLRLSIEGTNPHGGPMGAPMFGGQLQPRAILGAQVEANVDVQYTTVNGAYADGETYQLRKPVYTLTNTYTALPANVLVSARMASPIFGLGLLEAISAADIQKQADEMDLNQDGISGKVNWVWDVMNQTYSIGRFGWKAGMPSIIQQSAGAYNEDMGVTNFIFPVESSIDQPQHALSKGKQELSDSILFAVAYYIKTLAVPGRRDVDKPEVKQGKMIFNKVGCNACHKSYYTTQTDVIYPEVSNQHIFPYTDLLLHDMGDDLSDHRQDNKASGNEWRTAPLWGIGLSKTVNGHNNFLHDGRARSLSEAILWHGGEAEKSRLAYKNLSKADRTALIAFLQSL
ncbi:MAG: di-heme oxidoredictase family protein [Bacteroidota bacterium]